MAAYDHILDPDGDVIFTLRGQNASFALWGCSPPSPPDTANIEPFSGPASPPPPGDEELAVKDSVSGDKGLELLGANYEEAAEAETDGAIRFRMSSRHLILASQVFRAMLSGGWREDKAKDDGCFHISGEGWDAEAFLISMNIIHGHNRKVPRLVNLELLAKIATIIDYYKLHEAAEVFGSIWIEPLRGIVPTTYSRDLILWILVSQVFGKDEIFKEVTQVAVKHAPAKLDTLRLPILTGIEGELQIR